MTTQLWLIAIFAVAVPFTGAAQPAPESPDADAAARVIDRIAEIQARAGPASAQLIEPLTELAGYYQASGDLALAVPIIDQALGLIRNNYGLSSFEQAPLMQLVIDSERARGNVAGAWETEQSLVRLARDNPQDLRTVPILRDVGDRRIDMIGRYLVGEYVPEVLLGCYYKAPRHHMANCHAGSKSDAVASILLDASEMYRDAADVIRRANVYPSEELTALETARARNFFIFGRPRTRESAYELGRASLVRLYDWEVEHSGPALEQARALVLVADWDLVYVRQPLAIDTYERALTLLQDSGATPQDISDLFSPSQPIAIPTFADGLLNDPVPEDTERYVDVAFEISKYGRSRKVDVLDRSNASDAAVDELTQAIRLNRFRPRIDAGGSLGSTEVTARYYLAEER